MYLLPKFLSQHIKQGGFVLIRAEDSRKFLIGNPDKIKPKLNGLKYTNKEVNDIWLLLHMMRPAQVIKDLPMFKKLQSNSTLKAPQLTQWARIYSNNIKKLWNWKISTTAKDAIAKGLKGKDIGDYIRNKEEELFISS